MKSYVISIAAGKSQIPLIQLIRDMGYGVICVDINPNAPGFEFADIGIVSSVYDHTKVLNKIEMLGEDIVERIVGVVTKSSGKPVLTTAYVAEKFDLPGISPEIIKKLIYKSGFIQACKDANLPVPDHIQVSELNDSILMELNFPLILKPDQGLVGKRGIHIVNSYTELNSKFQFTKKYSNNGIVEIEDFIPGSDVISIGYFFQEDFISIGLINELVTYENERIISRGYHYPLDEYSINKYDQIIATNKDFQKKFNLQYGIVFLAFRVNLSEFQIIEAHLDFAGDFLIDEFLPFIFKFDLMREAIKVQIDQPPEIARSNPRNGIILFLHDSDELNIEQLELKLLSQFKTIKIHKKMKLKNTVSTRKSYIIIETNDKKQNLQIKNWFSEILDFSYLS